MYTIIHIIHNHGGWGGKKNDHTITGERGLSKMAPKKVCNICIAPNCGETINVQNIH